MKKDLFRSVITDLKNLPSLDLEGLLKYADAFRSGVCIYAQPWEYTHGDNELYAVKCLHRGQHNFDRSVRFMSEIGGSHRKPHPDYSAPTWADMTGVDKYVYAQFCCVTGYMPTPIAGRKRYAWGQNFTPALWELVISYVGWRFLRHHYPTHYTADMDITYQSVLGMVEALYLS